MPEISILCSAAFIALAFLAVTIVIKSNAIFEIVAQYNGGGGNDKQWMNIATLSSAKHSNETSMEVSAESEFGDRPWNDEKLFETEKRAIFSKVWLYAMHRSQFKVAGQYHVLDVAQYPIFLIMGKDQKIRAFFNICAHRAYKVTKKDQGSSMLLGCRYHGWVYNSLGELVKAPHFDDIPGFDKSKNGLYEIQTWMDDTGMIFVNLDKKQVTGSNNTARYSSDLSFVSSFETTGAFNWKTVVSEYGRPTHNDLDITVPLSFSSRVTGMTMSRGVPLGRLYSVPGSTLFYSISVRPLAASETSIHLELYNTRKETTQRELAWFQKLQKSIESGVKTIEQAQQLESGLAVIDRETSSDKEVSEMLRAHTRLERGAGMMINPAARERNVALDHSKAADLCRQVEDLAAMTEVVNGNRDKMVEKEDVLAW